MRRAPRWRALAACAFLALWALAGPALAHKGSDAYLEVQEQLQFAATAGSTPTAPTTIPATPSSPGVRNYRLVLAVAIKDLDLLLPLDANADGKVTWGEARAAMPAVLALVNEALGIEPQAGAANATPAPAAACSRLNWALDGFDRRGDGAYVRLQAQTACPPERGLALRYTLLRDQDANHRLLVAGRVGGKDLLTTASPLQPGALELVAAVPAGQGSVKGNANLSAEQARQPAGRWQALRDYFLLGVHHLLEGYDHLAFLLALVLPLRLALFGGLPAALPSVPGPGGAAGKAVWWALLRTITAFTVGHSITLILATFGWVQASPRWVEPAIALSIAVTAALTLRPTRWVRTDVRALLFGLVHGLGFAGLLLEAAAPGGLLPWALAGFNLGVEAGQLIAVSAWVLLSQPLVTRPWYPSVVVRGGSVLLILLALWWFWQRVS